MAIELSIQPKKSGPESARTVPIATLDTFRRDWLPASQALELAWIPMFETGLPVSLEDVASLVAELRQLEEWVTTHQPEAAARIGDRVRGLVAELEAAQDAVGFELYIG